MSSKLIFTLFLLIVTCYLLIVKPASAGFSCQPIYGGGQTCTAVGNLGINKTVMNPKSGKMAESLGINDPKYSPDNLVTFQIALSNTGDSPISHVDVKDIFPQYVLFNTGAGNFDQNSKTLSFRVEGLKPNETRTFTLVGKIVSADKLPSSQMVVCVINQVSASSNNNASSQDNAQFCIEKKAPPQVTKGGFPVLSPVPVTTTPPTGPESLFLFSLIPTGIAGWFLRKNSYKSKNETASNAVKGGEK